VAIEYYGELKSLWRHTLQGTRICLPC